MAILRNIIVGFLLFMAGCAPLTEDMQLVPKLDKKQDQAQNLSEKIGKNQGGFFRVDDGFYLDGQEVVIQVDPLPNFFNKKVRLKEDLYLYGIADRVSKLFDISVALAPDVTESDLNSRSMPVDYAGSLKLLLDSVASYYGLYWRFEKKDARIQFFKTETKTYTLLCSPGKTTISSKLSNSSDSSAVTSSGSGVSSSGSQSTSTEQSTHTESLFAIWETAVEDVKNMIGDESKVTANSATGTLTVTATPGIQYRVQKYVEQINAKLGRQVSLNIRIISFSAEDARNRGIQANLMFTDITGAQISFGAGDVGQGADGTSFMKSAILEDQASTTKLRAFFGSSLLINALRKKGRVSIVNSVSGIVLNNTVFPIQELARKGYLASVTSTLSQSGETTTSSLQAGQVVTGLSMQITPHILENNKVLLSYHMNLSTLNDIDSVESGEQKIQFPDTSERSMLQRVMCSTGSTVVLAGYVKDSVKDKDSTGLLAKGSDEQDDQEILIIAIDVNEVSLS